jgi:hypothetical protein
MYEAITIKVLDVTTPSLTSSYCNGRNTSVWGAEINIKVVNDSIFEKVKSAWYSVCGILRDNVTSGSEGTSKFSMGELHSAVTTCMFSNFIRQTSVAVTELYSFNQYAPFRSFVAITIVWL